LTLGPYEITRDGRTYHGNVRLKEHHLVARKGRYCLFLVPDMTAAPVGPAVAAALARLKPGFADLVPDALMHRGKEARFGTTTNATLLSGEKVAYIAAERIEPLVSFDGPAEIHDRQRPFRNGRGSYRRVHGNVQKLRAAMPKLAGRATVCAGCDPFAVDGSVYPCHRFVGFEEARMGDLGSCRAGEINDYHRAVVENLPACRACWARHLCGGGFYENLARTGDMHRPDPLFCRETKAVCPAAPRRAGLLRRARRRAPG